LSNFYFSNTYVQPILSYISGGIKCLVDIHNIYFRDLSVVLDIMVDIFGLTNNRSLSIGANSDTKV